MMNQLQHALSPYLLQHQNNPVYWQEWGESAFKQAQQHDAPILLSIGYAACHWCHVMAHESFEHPATAEYLNEHFVCIKVDKEERPDIDQIYMQALLKMQGQGGWPLTVFLTPEGHPFFAGTYFPKDPIHGMPSFQHILEKIVQTWQQQRDDITQAEDQIKKAVYQDIQPAQTQQTIDINHIQRQYHTLLTKVDSDNGGLQGAPKFPQMALWVSWFQVATLFKQQQGIQANFQMARSLAQGGIYDHLAGGFFRYSTDEQWLAPHFEKMLYDNAQIINWMSQLYAYQPQAYLKQRIQATIHWLDREMLLQNGCYAASLDADSEGEEGRFYTWSWSTLQSLLNENELEVAQQYFGLKPDGNWEGVNILYCGHLKTDDTFDTDTIERIKHILWQSRQQRVRPERDDKVLLDWNAMLVTALAQAGQRLNEPEWIEKARYLFNSLQGELFDGNYWQHACRADKTQTKVFLADYAHTIQAAITLSTTTGQNHYLRQAQSYWQQAQQLFLQSGDTLYRQASVANHDLPHNPQPIIDGAEPSGNGIMAINGMLLHLLTGQAEYADNAQNVLDTLAGGLHSEHCYELPSLVSAVLWYHHGLKIQGPWLTLTDQPSGLLPTYLLQTTTDKLWQACNHYSCWAQAETLSELDLDSSPNKQT